MQEIPRRQSYDLDRVEQWDPPTRPPVMPEPGDAATRWAEVLATDATIYGLGAVLQYGEMYVQAVDAAHPRYTGFFIFDHQRAPADPSFEAFRVPTVDNLYSNAFLDLAGGPALVRIPPMGERYYTLNLLDAYGNAYNLSARTVGANGGDYLIAPPRWWDAPRSEETAHATMFRVATPAMWILMRVSLADSERDWSAVHALQDRVTIHPSAPPTAVDEFPPADPDSVRTDAMTFFAALDFVLRQNGSPVQEEGLVFRFRGIGLGGAEPFDADRLDDGLRRALAAGYHAGRSIVDGTRRRSGTALAGTGWNSSDPGRYGFDTLSRAVTNFLGLGGNVAAENKPFVTFVDAQGEQLDGASASYRLHLDRRPPGRDLWSLTLYDVPTGQVYDHPLRRYKIGTGVAGTGPSDDGSWTVTIQHEEPDDVWNWLPAPAGPFFLAIRTWRPDAEVLDGTWTPAPVRRLEHAEAAR